MNRQKSLSARHSGHWRNHLSLCSSFPLRFNSLGLQTKLIETQRKGGAEEKSTEIYLTALGAGHSSSHIYVLQDGPPTTQRMLIVPERRYKLESIGELHANVGRIQLPWTRFVR